MEKFNQLRYNHIIDICQKGRYYGQTGEKEKNMFIACLCGIYSPKLQQKYASNLYAGGGI